MLDSTSREASWIKASVDDLFSLRIKKNYGSKEEE
jgi:hypothetical protein